MSTDLYAIGKVVAVTMQSRGKDQAGRLAVNTDGTVFGYVTEYGDQITYMSYRLDEYFVPREVVTDAREKWNGLFYFDVGNEFTITASELERAFEELGLL